MSLSGVTDLDEFKFEIGASSYVYAAENVRITRRWFGKERLKADYSHYQKTAGYHLFIYIDSADIEQQSGTTRDPREIQLDAEDESTTLLFYPQASGAENFEVVGITDQEIEWLRTKFGIRYDDDALRLKSKSTLSKSDLSWYVKN